MATEWPKLSSLLCGDQQAVKYKSSVVSKTHTSHIVSPPM